MCAAGTLVNTGRGAVTRPGARGAVGACGELGAVGACGALGEQGAGFDTLTGAGAGGRVTTNGPCGARAGGIAATGTYTTGAGAGGAGS